MAPKSKKQKTGAKTYGETRGARCTRLNESTNAEHLHMELLKQGERIEQLRADLKTEKHDESAMRSLLSSAESDLARVVDAYGGPMRRMRNKICKLKQTIRALSNDVDDVLSPSSSCDDENNGECENGAGECDEDGNELYTLPLTRRRPKNGILQKKAGTVVAEASVEKYQQRKLIELEEAVDRLFHNALGTISVDGAEYSPNTMESRKRGSYALKWVLHRFMVKHPSLWANLLREKRTVQEAEEAAMARIRKHWEDKGLGIFSRCGMMHMA